MLSLLLLFGLVLIADLMSRPAVLTSDEPRVVISYGEDLTAAQRQEVEAFFQDWQGR